MKRNILVWVGALLVIPIALSLAGTRYALGVQDIQSTDDFIKRLEEEYRDIGDFSARLTISGLEPPLKVKLEAISEPRILRVEYLSPPEMEDQFFLLEGDFLFQYMPAQNLIIKKDLNKSRVPVKAANLTPDYLLELVKSEELEVNLVSKPGELYVPWGGKNVLDFDASIYWLDEEDYEDDDIKKSITPLSLDFDGDKYVLEVIPKVEGYQFARQVIKFDRDNLLPRELITYFEDDDKEPVHTKVDEVGTNVGLKREEVTKKPEDAEVILD